VRVEFFLPASDLLQQLANVIDLITVPIVSDFSKKLNFLCRALPAILQLLFYIQLSVLALSK